MSHPTAADLLAWLSGASDPALAGHVAACPRCQGVVEDWRTVGLAVTQRLESEADAVFTEERLARQREAVLRHRYELQYVLYVFALHRLLRRRLPGYDA